MSNPYTVLGVERNASEKEISKAYKRAALKWHPDKNTERPELAEKKFKEISDAFQLLNDPDKRAFFDRTGQRPDQQPQMRRRPQYGGAQQVYADELTPEDIFNMFFGVHPGAGRAGARRRTTGGGGGAATSAAAALTTAATAASCVATSPAAVTLHLALSTHHTPRRLPPPNRLRLALAAASRRQGQLSHAADRA
mmetsp:Transcript_48352/g.151959  ORF Transcript_48352/g.151959 Transcript_48352/m.151959 type:complete len:195 (+) Transcript_48352:111-695(+)